ncbi:lipid-A-disaccharide synthase-related protein [Synechococcus sp. UW140]|uniref:lipid-A-disaccharide synthase-related protein n=1 Tax=Synechococcus sp. UW140 TaxID=368503 RepID=UPI000E0E2F0C|nr:lipid-A-disaccharide synthase-related protein [Synechococcus sp. UW140]
MARLLLLSNGHGEDLSGALLGRALQRCGHQVDALPLVGGGHPYRDAGIPLMANTREFSTGGLGYTSLRGRLTELIQGQVLHLLQSWLQLIRIRRRYALVVVIGDVIPVMAAWLSGRPVATYLVAYSSHYEGRLNLPWPCGNCLSSTRFLAVYSRDLLSAEDLSLQLGRPVHFLGNPFMDPVLAPAAPRPPRRYRLALLPGSRRPELEQNLLLLLQVIQRLPAHLFSNQELAVDLALIRSLDDAALQALIAPHAWQIHRSDHQVALVKGALRVEVQRGAFASVLQNANLVISMAGTAAEQAVGLAKPVLQVAGKGPQFTANFAEAQRRLLGPTVFCAEGDSGQPATLDATAKLALELLEGSELDKALQRRCRQQAEERLGSMGGADRMASAITDLLPPSQPSLSTNP